MSVHVSGQVWQNGPKSASDKMMLLAIADNADDYGLAWPGVQRLADKCCVDKRTARRTIRRLEEDGWITVDVGGGSRGAKGIGIPSRYQIDMDKIAKRTPTSPPSKEDVDDRFAPSKGGVDDIAKRTPTSPEPSLEPSLNISPSSDHVSSPAATDRFDEFWSAYPKKVSKQAAHRAWKAAIKKADPEDIIAAMANHEALKRDPQFIPHASSWLNAGAWNDMPTVVLGKPLRFPSEEIVGHYFDSLGIPRTGIGSTRERRDALLGLLRSKGWMREQAENAINNSIYAMENA